MKTRDLMVRATAVCSPAENLNVAARRMRERDCGIIPVVNESREIVGVLTDRDIALSAVEQDAPLRDIPVGRAMSEGVHSVSMHADVEKIHEVMREYAVRRVPVHDEGRRLVGIVSIDDLAARSSGDGTASGAKENRMVAETLAAIARRHAVNVIPLRP